MKEIMKKYRGLKADHFGARVQVLIEEGLGGYKDHPEKLIVCAGERYLKTDLEFQLKYQKLIVDQDQELVMKLFTQDPSVNKAIEDFGRILSKNKLISTIPIRQSSKV